MLVSQVLAANVAGKLPRCIQGICWAYVQRM